MSAHNATRERACPRCGEKVVGPASAMRAHALVCKPKPRQRGTLAERMERVPPPSPAVVGVLGALAAMASDVPRRGRRRR